MTSTICEHPSYFWSSSVVFLEELAAATFRFCTSHLLICKGKLTGDEDRLKMLSLLEVGKIDEQDFRVEI